MMMANWGVVLISYGVNRDEPVGTYRYSLQTKIIVTGVETPNIQTH